MKNEHIVIEVLNKLGKDRDLFDVNIENVLKKNIYEVTVIVKIELNKDEFSKTIVTKNPSFIQVTLDYKNNFVVSYRTNLEVNLTSKNLYKSMYWSSAFEDRTSQYERLDKYMKNIIEKRGESGIKDFYNWCTSFACGCLGCANNGGGLTREGFVKSDWELWVKRNPNKK